MKRTVSVVAVMIAAAIAAAVILSVTDLAHAKPPRTCQDQCQSTYDKCVHQTHDQTTCFAAFCDCMCGPCNNCIC